MTPELSRSLEQFSQQMAQVDAVAHVLLKGHLLIEEALSRILDQYFFHRKHLESARLTFYQKLLLARGLCLRKHELGEWELMSTLNALRNEVAHKLTSPQREQKFARVKEVLFRETSPEHLQPLRNERDEVVLSFACAHCLGFLVRFENDSRQFRHLVHAMDREMNPELPAFEL